MTRFRSAVFAFVTGFREGLLIAEAAAVRTLDLLIFHGIRLFFSALKLLMNAAFWGIYAPYRMARAAVIGVVTGVRIGIRDRVWERE